MNAIMHASPRKVLDQECGKFYIFLQNHNIF